MWTIGDVLEGVLRGLVGVEGGLVRDPRLLVEDPPAPTVLIQRGPRPGGLAPPETRTRFRWSDGRLFSR